MLCGDSILQMFAKVCAKSTVRAPFTFHLEHFSKRRRWALFTPRPYCSDYSGPENAMNRERFRPRRVAEGSGERGASAHFMYFCSCRGLPATWAKSTPSLTPWEAVKINFPAGCRFSMGFRDTEFSNEMRGCLAARTTVVVLGVVATHMFYTQYTWLV